jgi:outer membrane lipoprotein SlyB
MTIKTLNYGTINIIKNSRIDKRFDTLIDSIEGCEIDEFYDIYQLADGKGTIVAVPVEF